MTQSRPKVPKDMKLSLIEETGGKCANPGCSNKLVEIHHIKEWFIYKTHDEQNMIAICPSCHDAIDRGNLQIDDETLYRWKEISHPSVAQNAHIYVEPGGDVPLIVLGTISVQSMTSFTVFDLSEAGNLEFCVRDNNILLPKLRISNNGQPLVDVIDGHLIQRDSSIHFDQRPGKVRVTDENLARRLPDWATFIVSNDPDINLDVIPLLDIEVLRPSVIRVMGVWIQNEMVVIINQAQLSFIYKGLTRPLSMIGDGDGTQSVLLVAGPSVLLGCNPLQ